MVCVCLVDLLCRLLTCTFLEQETLRLYPVVYVVVSPLSLYKLLY